MRIESIADHLDHVDTIARWHWDEWGHHDPDGSLQSWTEGLKQRTKRDTIPTTYIALDGDELLGSVTLVEHDMSVHLDLTPWLAGVFIKPERREQGVGTELVRYVVGKAAEMGVKKLYLYTGSAREFYEKLGWSYVTEGYYEGRDVVIMAIDTALSIDR